MINKPPRVSPLIEHAGFPSGYNNVNRPERMPNGAMAEAYNVDITNTGSVRSREGFVKVFNQACHSLWSCHLGIYFVSQGTLYRLADTPVVIATGMRSEAVSYALVNNDVYWSNGLQRGILRNGITPALWGIQAPNGGAMLSVVGGSLPRGTYQIRLTYVRGNGEESGASNVGVIDLTSGGGVRIDGLISSTDPEVIKINIYATRPNGTEFLKIGEVINGAASTEVTLMEYGETLKSLFKSPPPNATIVRYFKGHILCVAGDTIYQSDSFAYQWFDFRNGFVRMSGDITLCVPVNGGVYVSDAVGTYFLQGDNITTAQLRLLSFDRAVIGTDVMLSVSDTRQDPIAGTIEAIWTTNRSIVSGDDMGNLTDITSNDFTIPQAETGAAMLRKQHGATQYVTSLSADEGVANNSEFKSKSLDSAEITLISRGGVPV
jgi:hypothetical protein